MRGIRYKNNPFLEDMIVPVKNRQVRLSKLGRDQNILVNQGTGEILGTHVTTYKKVDGEQFIKLFTANLAMSFDLSSAGIKALHVLMWSVQSQAVARDEVYLDNIVLEDFLISYKDREPPLKLSFATLKRGLTELEGVKIIAKTMRQGCYFINPNFIFNGDRIAFTTVIERKKVASRDPNTVDMLEGQTDAEREAQD